MKKLIISAVIAFACSAMTSVSAKGLPKDYFEKDGSCWILRAGVSLNTFVGDGITSKLNRDISLGYDISAAFNKPIFGIGTFWGIEAGVATRGYKFSNKDYTESSQDLGKFGTTYTFIHTKETSKHEALNVYVEPLMFGYRKTVWKGLNIEARVGAFVSFDIIGNSTWKKGTRVGSFNQTLGITDLGNETWQDAKVNIADFEGYHRLDVGIAPAIGLWWSRIGVDVSYKRGFLETQKKGDAYSSQLVFRASYAF